MQTVVMITAVAIPVANLPGRKGMCTINSVCYLTLYSQMLTVLPRVVRTAPAIHTA